MLSNVVSIADVGLGHVVSGFAALFWQNPVASMVCLISMLGLSAMLWLELLTERVRQPRAVPQAIPLRIRR